MNVKQILISASLLASVAFIAPSCKSQAKKDAEAKAKIESSAPGVIADVQNGVATLSGEMADESAKASAESTAKGVANVKSVVNNLTVTPPPAPVVINPDEALIASSGTVVSAYPGVTASVSGGVITLTGEISKADWMKLRPQLDALRPKKVENNLTIK